MMMKKARRSSRIQYILTQNPISIYLCDYEYYMNSE